MKDFRSYRMHPNPYEPPQTIALTAARVDDHTRDTLDVIRGSRAMLLATAIGAGTMLVEIGVTVLKIEQLWGWFSWLLTILATLDGLLDAWGLWLMRRVPRDSGAKKFISIALVGMVLAILLYWSALGLTFLWQDYRWILGGYFVSAVVSWLGQLARQWGFRRIGQYYAVSRLRNFATSYLLLIFCYHGYNLTRLGWSFVNEPPELIYQHLATPRNMLDAPLSTALTFFILVLCVLTLRAFQGINPPSSEEYPLAT